MPTVERAVGRPAEHDEHGLLVFIVNNMRLRGFLVPQQLRALRRLRPPRGWPDTTEAHIGARDPLARRVCKLVHAREVEMYLFGNLSVVCRARDTFELDLLPGMLLAGRTPAVAEAIDNLLNLVSKALIVLAGALGVLACVRSLHWHP